MSRIEGQIAYNIFNEESMNEIPEDFNELCLDHIFYLVKYYLSIVAF